MMDGLMMVDGLKLKVSLTMAMDVRCCECGGRHGNIENGGGGTFCD